MTTDSTTNYAQRAVDAAHEAMPGEQPGLIRLYTLLAFTKGETTTLQDVHDAYALYMDMHEPWRQSLVPFEELPDWVAEYDRPYMEAIHKVAREVAR